MHKLCMSWLEMRVYKISFKLGKHAKAISDELGVAYGSLSAFKLGLRLQLKEMPSRATVSS